MAEVQLQRQRRDSEKRERGEQRQPVGGLDCVHAKDALERGQNEGARHQAGDEWIQDDQHAPLKRDLVRIHEAFNAVHKTALVASSP